MQILIKAESIEELSQVLESMKTIPTNAGKKTAAATAAPAITITPQMTSASATTGATPAPAPSAPAPAPWKAVTRQDVQTKAIALMDAGKQTQLQALLMKYGVPALPSIPEDQLAAFMADLEVL